MGLTRHATVPNLQIWELPRRFCLQQPLLVLLIP
jgi:hypothetical protein